MRVRVSRRGVAEGLQVVGGSALVVAGFLVAVVAGFVVLGVVALVFGVALERDVDRPPELTPLVSVGDALEVPVAGDA